MFASAKLEYFFYIPKCFGRKIFAKKVVSLLNELAEALIPAQSEMSVLENQPFCTAMLSPICRDMPLACVTTFQTMSDNLDNTPMNSDEAAAGEAAAENLTPSTAQPDADILEAEVEEDAAAVLPPAIGTEAARLRLGLINRKIGLKSTLAPSLYL